MYQGTIVNHLLPGSGGRTGDGSEGSLDALSKGAGKTLHCQLLDPPTNRGSRFVGASAIATSGDISAKPGNILFSPKPVFRAPSLGSHTVARR